MSGALNLDIGPQRQLVNGNTRPAGLGFLVEDLVIDLVDGSEISNVGQEDVDLYDVVDAASGGVENLAEVGQRLGLGMELANYGF